MSSKGKFITILAITLLTLLGVVGLVVLNLDELKEIRYSGKDFIAKLEKENQSFYINSFVDI